VNTFFLPILTPFSDLNSLTHSHSSSFSSLWNELRIILHNRENTLVTQAVKMFARKEQEYAESVLRNWVSLGEVVENMPYE